jgi:hypothetical protein
LQAGADARVAATSGQISFHHMTIRGGRAGTSNGGNIYNFGALELAFVHVTDGVAENGGGVANDQDAALYMHHSLVTGNRAVDDGGGLYAGGASDFRSSIDLENSTVSGNTAGAGGGIALDNYGIGNFTATTIARNTGGGLDVSSLADAEVRASIVALNGTADCFGVQQISDEGANLESDDACGFTEPSSEQAADPLLSPQPVDRGGETNVLEIGAGSPARNLVPVTCAVQTDQRNFPRWEDTPQPCDAGAYDADAVSPEPAPTPTPTPEPTPDPTVVPAPQPPLPTPVPTPVAPVPVAGQTVVAQPVRGTVRVRRRGSREFVELVAGAGIPLGSTVDTKRGAVEITTAAGERATFFDGIFRITQSRGITNLTLTEPLAACPRRGRAAQRKPKTRRLWGDGRGRFRISGRYSAATIRGTRWMVRDSCAGTLTRVTQGSVTVRYRGRTIIVRANRSFLARPRR